MIKDNKPNDPRRKSGAGSKPSMIVTLNVKPDQLRLLLQTDAVKEETPAQDTPEVKASPDSAATLSAPASNGNGENAPDSNAATPQPEGTPATSVMGPPTEAPKKKGVKRSAAKADGTDGTPKQRGRPGPKKKPRLEDGTIDHASAANRAAGHKLGPKANQGAINAGLRALDRSGKPCRKWAKGGFKLKSFTGVVWEIPRWTAPPKKSATSTTEEDSAATLSADNSSGKENKDVAAEGPSGSNSNTGVDVEMQSTPSMHASSPAPMAMTAVAATS